MVHGDLQGSIAEGKKPLNPAHRSRSTADSNEVLKNLNLLEENRQSGESRGSFMRPFSKNLLGDTELLSPEPLLVG